MNSLDANEEGITAVVFLSEIYPYVYFYSSDVNPENLQKVEVQFGETPSPYSDCSDISASLSSVGEETFVAVTFRNSEEYPSQAQIGKVTHEGSGYKYMQGWAMGDLRNAITNTCRALFAGSEKYWLVGLDQESYDNNIVTANYWPYFHDDDQPGIQFGSTPWERAFDAASDKQGNVIFAAINEGFDQINVWMQNGKPAGTPAAFTVPCPAKYDYPSIAIGVIPGYFCIAAGGEGGAWHLYRYSYNPSDLSEAPKAIDDAPIEFMTGKICKNLKVCVAEDKLTAILFEYHGDDDWGVLGGVAVDPDGAVYTPYCIKDEYMPLHEGICAAALPGSRFVVGWSDESASYLRNYPMAYGYKGEEPLP